MSDEDQPVLEKVAYFDSQIAQSELEIEKINTAINIDGEKDAIGKMEKGIKSQQQKISIAEDVIADFEKQIGEANDRIKEMEKFLADNSDA